MFMQLRKTDDKSVLEKALSHFDGFHVGASLLSSLGVFVQDVGKPFFIDPMTYRFILPPEHIIDREKGTVPRWMRYLAKTYSPILEHSLGKKTLTANDLNATRGGIQELTCNTLEYERTRFDTSEPALINKYFDKYDAFEEIGDSIAHNIQGTRPSFVIPPFFLVEEVGDPWYRLNLICSRIAAEQKKPEELLYGVLFLRKEILLNSECVDIVRDYADRRLAGIALWVNGLSEESANTEILSNLIRLIDGFRSIGKVVLKLNGSYLSILMNHNGLSGFSCSLSYRSDRDVNVSKWIIPGPPKAKFYIPGLHQAYSLDETEHVLRMFPFLKCSCRVCRDSYGNDLDIFQLEMKKVGYCQNHFLNARKAELDGFAQRGISGAIEDINEVLYCLKKKNAKGARHLTKWLNLMKAVQSVGTGIELPAKVNELESASIRHG